MPIAYSLLLTLYLQRKEMTCLFLSESLPTETAFFLSLERLIAPQIDHLEPIISDFFATRKQQ